VTKVSVAIAGIFGKCNVHMEETIMFAIYITEVRFVNQLQYILC
jgi:hypothetical protein